MVLQLLVALFWGLGGAALAMFAVDFSRKARMRARLTRMGLTEQSTMRAETRFNLRSAVGMVGGWIQPRVPGLAPYLAGLIDAAGFGGRVGPSELIGWKAVGLLAALLIGLPLVSAGGASGVLVLVILLGLGGFGPDLWLIQRRETRQRAIFLALPSTVDLIALTLEAGMELDQALHVVASRLRNPLGEELQRVLLDRQLGFSQGRAFRRLAERANLDEIRALSVAIIQAEELGNALVPVMQAQSRQIRVARRRYAEAEALRAPVKMMFPMAFFILPALFLVVLGPAGLQIMQAMLR